MNVLGLTDGSAGMAAQVRALADAMGYHLSERIIHVRPVWHRLPNLTFDLGVAKVFPVTHEWPDTTGYDVVISCGRKAALVAASLAGIKKIHIQDPQMSTAHFDVVVAMAHDKVAAPNVIKTTFALHNITPEKLASARERWAGEFAALPKPHIAVLLGGSTNKYTLTPARMHVVIDMLEARLQVSGGSLLITPSRRTGEANIAMLNERFSTNKNVYIYNGHGENPYLGFLALADELVVSNDSVNMMTEAYVTGRPLHIMRFCGHANTKPARFAEMLVARGAAQWLSVGGAVAHVAENEMATVAESVRQMLTKGA